jgi:hypothetical protein
MGMIYGVPLKCGSAGSLWAVLVHWEQWWLIKSNYGSLGSSGGSLVGAVVAHLSGAWLIGGRSGGSLVGGVVAHWWDQWWLIGSDTRL